ncbi:SusC/RagA family TonB-linked outer membrane protein [Pedobacter frigoris]|nr:SusC/RagA family TonB-linked outer membrane protein [Pedobacter frigoris]
MSQNIKFKGKVADPQGSPLSDVLITLEGTEVTAITDRLGAFEIKASAGQVLVVTLDGYTTVKVQADAKAVSNIVLKTSIKNHFDLLYGTIDRSKNLQSVSQVENVDLVKAPVNNLRNAMTGRLTGLYILGSTGNPIFDASTLTLRGTTPSIMIDGVFRDYLSMAPEEIESITVLKDGLSTALLGQRGANGIVSVKTRKGSIGKLEVSLKAQAGVQTPIGFQKPLEASQWAILFNEAMVNDGSAPVYTNADIEAYKNGSDPLGHPNVNWFNTLLEPNSAYSRYNLYASGGTRSARYFTSVDYLSNDGLFKTDAVNPYNTNTNFTRAAIRSNVEADLNKSLTLGLGIFARVQSGNEPGTSSDNIFTALYNTPNNAYPEFVRADSLGTSADYQNNLWGLSTRSGYTQRYNRDLSFDVSLRKSLDEVTKGLWVKASGTYNTTLQEITNRNKTYAAYQRIVNPTTSAVTYQQYASNGQLGNPSAIVSTISRNIYFDFMAGYDKTWDDHELNLFMIANTQSVVSGASNLPYNYNLIGTRANYAYKNKYLAELAISYSGHNMYAPGNRYGFFPAVGLGWVLSEERFMENAKVWLNNFKIRGTYGHNGNNNVGYYVYNQYYGSGSGYMIGSGATTVSGITMGSLANPNISWEKANKFNIGFDAALVDNKISVSFDYYNNKYYDLAQVRGKNSALLGDDFPNENIGKRRYYGLELDVTYQGKVNEFNYFISGNFSTQNSKLTYFDEVNQPYEWMWRTGQRVGQTFGYLADGFYNTDAEAAANASTEGYVPRAGDIKYVDLNKDGVINFLDQTSLLSNKPLYFYGANLGLSWKGFDVSVLLQGAANRRANISGNTAFAFSNNGKGQAWPINMERWTPETANTAEYPRLSISNSSHSQALSSFWIKRADYLRLKNAEIGYTLPRAFTSKIKLSMIRFFVNGQNLLTSSMLDYQDPEGYSALYPMQRVINGGINVKF